MTGSRNNRFVCGGFGVMVVAALAAWGSAPVAFASTCAYVPPLPIVDCNGNGIVDADDITSGYSDDGNGNGIPDECDFQICDDVWDGFPKNDAPVPFQYNQRLSEIDYNGDGFYWDNPEETAIIGLYGCNVYPPTRFDFSVCVSVPSSGDPEEGYVASEYLRTFDGELECDAAVYSLSFNPRVQGVTGDTEFNHKYDWQYYLYDGRVRPDNASADPDQPEDGAVILIEFVSFASEREFGATELGKILVKNPAGGYLNTGVPLVFQVEAGKTWTQCFDIQVVLDNRDDSVKLYIGGELKADTTRLDPDARRVDYFHLQAVRNNATTSANTMFRLDKFHYCLTGPALMDWPDCNGNCVDDYWDIENSIVEDCNASAVPDTCEGVWNCSCEEPAVADACIPCNHDHQWDFDTEAPAFSLGSIHCQNGWELAPTTDEDGGLIIASGSPFQGQPGFSGRALMLSPRPGGNFVDAQGIRGPRTHDEQPERVEETDDPGLEYWEFDVVIDAIDEEGEVFFVVWDECTGTFTHNDTTAKPACFTDSPPLCFLIREGEGNINTYARFNAGVRFRYRGPPVNAQEVNILQDGYWTSTVHSGNAEWYTNTAKHVTIKIDNVAGLLTYWKAERIPGELQWGQIHLVAGAETSNATGDRQVLILNTSNDATAYFDNLRYSTDGDCDHDGYPDSLYWLETGEYHEWYCDGFCCDTNDNSVVDWCEDCNRDCTIDTLQLTNNDCNDNGIPDECDIDPSLPAYFETAGCSTPWCDPIGGWSYYTRKGGGSFDGNTNGIPDECETALDCNGNGMLDACELDCEDPECPVPPPGCGQGNDCQPNGTLDACEEDCDDDGTPDDCAIAGGSPDCQPNGIPDECEEDCDDNGTPDDCDITADPSLDCNGDGILDQCQILPDCNANGVMDACDIADCSPADPDCDDCQPNGVPDECDIREGTSEDANTDGVPDECVLGLDIKPGSCPNPLNRNSHGILPVAMVGSETFDVMQIDVYSVLLSRADGVGGDVAPNEGPPGPHSTFEDVATPFEGDWCDCHDATGDGILDLSLKFRTDDLVNVLELDDLLPGALVELVLSGTLADGGEFIASDCVRIVPPGSSPALLVVQSNAPGAWLDVTPLDDTLDGGGFADFERIYPSGSVVTLTASPTHDGVVFAGWELDGTRVGEGLTLTITLPADETVPEAVYVPVSRLPAPAPTPTPMPRPAPRPVIR